MHRDKTRYVLQRLVNKLDMLYNCKFSRGGACSVLFFVCFCEEFLTLLTFFPKTTASAELSLPVYVDGVMCKGKPAR